MYPHRYVSEEDLRAAIEAREAREREEEEQGARQRVEMLTREQSGMSRRYTFDVSGEHSEEDTEQ
jgi:hypothetical protein